MALSSFDEAQHRLHRLQLILVDNGVDAETVPVNTHLLY